MLGIAPLAFMLIEVALCGFAKNQQLGLGGGQFGLLSLAMIDRIDAVGQQLASGAGALTRLLERKRIRRPQPEPTLAAVALEAQQPALAAGRPDLQVEPRYGRHDSGPGFFTRSTFFAVNTVSVLRLTRCPPAQPPDWPPKQRGQIVDNCGR